MSEGGENKENPINHELDNEFDSWIKNKENEKAEREKRISESFSRIDKHLKNIEKMSNKEKETGLKVTWGEMREALLQKSDDGKPIVKSEFLIKAAKNLSTASKNRLDESNLKHLLQRVDDGYYGGEFGEEESAIIGGVIDKKLTELKEAVQRREIFKGINPSELAEEKSLAEFYKKRINQEKELDDIFKKEEKELTDSDRIRAIELIEYLYKQPLPEMDLSFLGGSSEKPPKVEEIGVEAYREWFEDKIHALLEEYPDQNFETNWTLTYTIQQAVNNLWPKDGKDEFTYKIKDVNGQEIIKKDSYARLRKELALKLESYRAVHNFIYLYRRVPGIAEAIGPAGLLETKYLQCLLSERGKDKDGNDYGVAQALRDFYTLGGKYRELSKEYGGDELIDEQKKLTKEAENEQGRNWQKRVAGALYSAFQGGGRDGHLVLNEGGDFFTGRLYNMPDWAKRLWEETWKRSPWPGLYKALDLKVKNFWSDTLGNYTTEELRKLGIRREDINGSELEKEWVEKEKNGKKELKMEIIGKWVEKEKNGKKELKKMDEHDDRTEIYRFDNADFEKIDLAGNKNITPDHLKHVILDLEEADTIRKMILNPKGLLDNPGFSHINVMWERFKHLKGKKRSEWFAGVIKELIWFFRDRTAPWSDSLPSRMRKGPAKEVFPYFTPMTDEQLTNVVWALTPPLHREDANNVLNKAIGPKKRRTFVRGVRIGVETVGSMAIEGIKAALGLK
jgi:hypothetical protein